MRECVRECVRVRVRECDRECMRGCVREEGVRGEGSVCACVFILLFFDVISFPLSFSHVSFMLAGFRSFFRFPFFHFPFFICVCQGRMQRPGSRNNVQEKGLVWLNDEGDSALPTSFTAWIKVGIPKDSHQYRILSLPSIYYLPPPPRKSLGVG